ncbi:MAG: DEAD/DEAH box helicase [Candidatus Altiarchaeota archaeon]|nr:DEAD/DEAH box helicase [Candidatus Altiarchaeota archaeon]
MRTEELPLGRPFKDLYLSEGISELYPPQQLLVESGVLEGKSNLVLCTPTASGKTFASEILIAKKLEEGKKAVYVAPLRALAYEKYTEFRKYESLGYRVRLEMGDLDSGKYGRKKEFDILVTTAEKCDSILRSRPDWFNDTGVLVMDEIHLINTDRGPVYEILISKFQKLLPGIQVLALSATIGNAKELSSWLDAGLIESGWRPVKLHESVEAGADKYRTLKDVVGKSVSKGGQALVFVNSRRSAESVAERLGKDLGLEGKGTELDKTAEDILSALSAPTQQCKRLSSCVKTGTAFHHAGLVNKQRTLIEDEFKKGVIKVITATPTLAAGVNLPARTVIVRDFTRFGGGELGYITVMEYKQQAGRAGRPKFDKEGNAVCIASSDSEKELIEEKYINGTIEPVTSKLGIEPVLRFHMLASIASGFTRTREALLDFFKSTFFGYQYGLTGFESLMDRITLDLVSWGFIETEGRFLTPTALGRRVSELYIDPRTAKNYLDILQEAESSGRFPALGLLEMLCDSSELPLLYLKRSEESGVWADAFNNSEELYRDLPGFGLDAKFLERYKTAKLFEAWISELSEETILELYKVAPGILNQKLRIAEWLAYSAAELTGIMKLKRSEKEMRRLETRIKHGVKEELIPLVSIKGIGRARARKLLNAGYGKPSDIRKASIKELKPLLGEKTAQKIRKELGAGD